MNETRVVRGMLPALLGAALFVSGDDVYSQSLYAGLKGGISIPSLRGGNSEISEGYSSRMGPDAGVYIGDRLSDEFAIQVEAVYSSQGGKKDGMQLIPDGTLPAGTVPPGISLYANYNNETALNYLEVPVLLRYTMDAGGSLGISRVYFDAGPYVGFLLSATNRTGGVSSLYLDKSGTPLLLPPAGQPLPPMDFTATTDVSSDISKLNAGLTGGIGLAKSLGPGDLILDARGAYGLRNIQTDPKNGRNNTGNFVIALGYEMQL
ncbi:MAG TPA: porin family protein [Bacteroidota bacterium]|nr:porin family protein [Bacteroidota bacterium]